MLQTEFGQKHFNDFLTSCLLCDGDGFVLNVRTQNSGKDFDNDLRMQWKEFRQRDYCVSDHQINRQRGWWILSTVPADFLNNTGCFTCHSGFIQLSLSLQTTNSRHSSFISLLRKNERKGSISLKIQKPFLLRMRIWKMKSTHLFNLFWNHLSITESRR